MSDIIYIILSLSPFVAHTHTQDGKIISDYLPIFQRGTRISYWWSDEDGWLHGYITNGLKKVVTTSTIKWTTTVKFDNGVKHILSFHPMDKRWKVPIHSATTTISSSTASLEDAKQSEKSVSVEQHPVSSTKSTKKPEGAKKMVSTKATVSETTVKKVAEGGKKRSAVGGKSSSIKKSKPAAVVDMKDTQQLGAVATSGKTSIKSSSSSSTTKRKGYKQLSLSFGLQLQQPPPPPKVQAVAGVDSSNNSHTPQTNILAVKSSAHATKTSSEPCRSTGKVDDSRSSLLAAPAPSQQQNATKKQRRQSIGSSERHFVTSRDVGVASQNNSVAKKSIGEKGISKHLPAEKAIANLSEGKDPLQADDERQNESTMTKKRKAHSSAIDRDHSSVRHESKKAKVEKIVKELDTVVLDAEGIWELIQVCINVLSL
jgi:hypothetical protein